MNVRIPSLDAADNYERIYQERREHDAKVEWGETEFRRLAAKGDGHAKAFFSFRHDTPKLGTLIWESLDLSEQTIEAMHLLVQAAAGENIQTRAQELLKHVAHVWAESEAARG
jgi:hypothetical protein